MAPRNKQIGLHQRFKPARHFAGLAGLSFIGFITIGAFVALAMAAGRTPQLTAIFHDDYIWHIVRFTIFQAFLSAILAVIPAAFTARAFSRQPTFFARHWLLKLFALPLALPPLVGVLGVLGLWGQAGWINTLFHGVFHFNIFGLTGILITHVFFNLPLATRLFLAHLERIPAENWRLAMQLGLPAKTVFRLMEWPVLKAALPGIFTLVFMLCLTSFTIVLTVGGGPASTTLEVAIYQALRFDFDPPRAIALALLQLMITTGFLLIASRFTKTIIANPTLRPLNGRPRLLGHAGKFIDYGLIGVTGLFVTLPLFALLLDGLAANMPDLLQRPDVWHATGTSLLLALAVALLSMTLCWTLAKPISNEQSAYAKIVSLATSIILVIPAIIIGTGWFILLYQLGDVFSHAPFLVVIINSLMALPFIHRILTPAMAEANQRHKKLSANLGVSGWTRFYLIDLPTLRKPVILGLAFAMALSIGDLGVIALFGSEGFTTLPLLLFRSLGSYRTNDAQGLALLLAILCLVILYLAEYLANAKSPSATPKETGVKHPSC